jgi:hypothetical protein
LLGEIAFDSVLDIGADFFDHGGLLGIRAQLTIFQKVGIFLETKGVNLGSRDNIELFSSSNWHGGAGDYEGGDGDRPDIFKFRL